MSELPAPRVVVLAGGSPHAHDFASSGAALAELAAGGGFDVTMVEGPDDAAAALDGEASALAVLGLWWRMEGEAYDEWRPEHGYSPPEATRRAIATFVADGGGLLAMHTASICFDDWPEWGRIVGGAWRWDSSSHPAFGPISARVIAEHPIVAGLASTLTLDDEVYGDLAIEPDLSVLAVAKRHPADADQPVVWAHRYGSGRIAYDGFGHDAASIRHPHHARLLLQALRWVAR